MLTSLISSLVILSGAGLVSASSFPTFAVANLIPGPMGPLSGSVLFTSAGEGVTVSLLISGFPPESGPWPYHSISLKQFSLIIVHQYPVTGNNCSTSGPPFALANETNIPVPCLPDAVPNGCRAGDMAGRFGNLSSLTSEMTASYYDPYISLDPTAPNYVGNLSFNVHWANFSVIACCKYSPSDELDSFIVSR
jgi:hypothetical protein